MPSFHCWSALPLLKLFLKLQSLNLYIILQIERWWRELHERLEKFYKEKLRWLKDQNHYNPQNETDRYVT